MMVDTAGKGVHGFTLDAALGAFLLSHENIRMPDQGSYYSVNDAGVSSWPRTGHAIGGMRAGLTNADDNSIRQAC